jgi:CRP-like cAMP-binding protein
MHAHTLPSVLLTQVIKQGDQGDDFFVVETGNLRVFVVFSGRQEEVEVRTHYE